MQNSTILLIQSIRIVGAFEIETSIDIETT